MELRSYQKEAIAAGFAAMGKSLAPHLLVLPTGAGKSAVIAALAVESVIKHGARVLVLSHVRELIAQVAETIPLFFPDAPPVGIYSAGMGERETTQKIICAGIQSVHKRATELGRFDLVLVDECHLMPNVDDGMYRSMWAELRVINPNVRLLGLTATDYRMDCGRIHGPDKLFEKIAYEIGVRTLIDQEYLCPLRGKNLGSPDLSSVHIRGGEYIPAELAAVMDDSQKVDSACDDMVRHGRDRNHWLVFCCGVAHAENVSETLGKKGISNAVIVGDTPSAERDMHLAAFKKSELRCLVSVGVLTTGFDAPHIDLISLLRPTLSTGLYYQMVGRGLRMCSSEKKNCMVLDFGANIQRHGPIDDLKIKETTKQGAGTGVAPIKTCPQCQEILPASAVVCNYCGFEMPRDDIKHTHLSADSDPLKKNDSEKVRKIIGVDFSVHRNKNENKPDTLRVDYSWGPNKYRESVSEWVCINHEGYARKKAESWWKLHTGDAVKCPLTVLDAFDYLEENGMLMPDEIITVQDGKWQRITEKTFSADCQPVGMATMQMVIGLGDYDDDEPPF